MRQRPGLLNCWSTPRRPSVGPASQRKRWAKVEIAAVATTVAENAVHPSFTKVPLTSAGEKGNIVGLQAEW